MSLQSALRSAARVRVFIPTLCKLKHRHCVFWNI